MKNVLSLLVLAAVATSVTISAEAVTVVPGDYAKSFTITFPGYSGSTTLTDFPVLVKISAARNGFDYSACQVSGGGDLRFADSSGNLLSSEVDTWNTSGESLVWVKVPSLDASTVITAYYGNANPPAVTASDVWSNGYVGVWHLNESLPPMVESSGVSTPFTQGQVAPTYAADGVIGKSVDFATKDDGSSNNRLVAADDDDLDGFGDFTVEYWTYQGSFRNNEYACILSKRNASGNEDSWMVCQDASTGTTQYPDCYLRSSVDGSRKSMSSALRPEANRWTYQAFTRVMDSGLQNWYFDGNSVRTTSDGNLTVSLPATASALKLGGGGYQNSFPGKIDEVRISSVARSADWVKASHDCVSVENFVVCTYEGQIDPEDYECSFNIAFTGYAGSTTLTDFPVLVRLSAALNGFDYSKCKVANGGDLRFADSSGNMLVSEIDTWNESGESLVWVKVPSFNRNTVITVCYGNATPPVALPLSAVWSSGYVAVWHLNESGQYMTDSSRADTPSSNLKLRDTRNDGTLSRGQSGLVGNAVQFDADGTHRGSLNTTDSRYSLSGSSGPFTVECWAYQNEYDATRNIHLISEVDSGNGWNSNWLLREIINSSPVGRICLQYRNDSNEERYMFSDTSGLPPCAEWNHVALRHDTSRLETRLNGSRIMSRTSDLTLFTTDGTKYLHIGNYGSGDGANGALPGLMDEVRISNVARSDDWLQATIDCVKKADFATCCATANDWKKYSRKFKVTFSGYDGSETLANFPVLVKVSESGISGFRYADCRKLNGGDLRFADAEGNLLASEVDTWNTNGVSLVWVKVPSLTAATMITAYYGWELAPIVDSSAVWANGYVGVWHLNESNSPMVESSGVSTPFTQGQVAPGYAADGVIGKSVDFATNDDNSTQNRLIAADDDDLDGFDDFTVEYWTCQESFRTSQFACILSKRNNSGRDNQESWMVCQNNNATTGQYPWFYLMPTEGSRSDLSSQKRPEAGQWTHQTITRVKDSGLVTWYFDGGERIHATKHTDTLFAGTAALKLGGGGGQYSFPGKIDEVRVSNVSRSADWVKASHDTVTESAFATYGAARENVNRGMSIIFR